MGEAAEMMLDGTCCAGCGEFLDFDAPGYPVYCSACGGNEDHENYFELSMQDVYEMSNIQSEGEADEAGQE